MKAWLTSTTALFEYTAISSVTARLAISIRHSRRSQAVVASAKHLATERMAPKMIMKYRMKPTMPKSHSTVDVVSRSMYMPGCARNMCPGSGTRPSTP